MVPVTADPFFCPLPCHESTWGFLSRPWHVPTLSPDVLLGVRSTAQALWP